MPELPDIEIYLEALESRIEGDVLESILLGSPFLLRSVAPAPKALEGKKVVELRRMGKRVVIALEDELFMVIHLMVAGRLQWKEGSERPKLQKKRGLARFDFASGSLTLTEAGTKKRASLRIVQGEDELARLDPGGLEVMEADLAGFTRALLVENHTLKRSLTDPHLFSGIGNAYSDEILHRAKLSPVKWTSRLSDDEIERLYVATRDTLKEWTEQLRAEQRGEFPTKVTAFRPEMAVHGRYGKECPDCGGPVQRIRYASNETNYCPACQTEGKLLADRGLSRLLKGDWPKSLEELEERKTQQRI
jgi:formamidopyrimidine-DNA glycosylase